MLLLYGLPIQMHVLPAAARPMATNFRLNTNFLIIIVESVIFVVSSGRKCVKKLHWKLVSVPLCGARQYGLLLSSQ